jgi:hypothetical protein
MIWLAYRQFRAQAAVALAALAALVAVLAITGPGLADDYSSGLASCTAQHGCAGFTQRFFSDHQAYYLALVVIVMVVPALIGVFWGAPLVTRELEAGTHRLVWNQSVTRARWLAVKLGLVGLAAMAAAGIAGAAVTWWSGPVDKAAGDRFQRITPLMFDARGIAPIGYAAFAFALGVTIGAMVRRTVPTMAITLAVFVALQVAMPTLIRPHLIPPKTDTVPITAGNLHDMRLKNNSSMTVTTEASDPRAWTISNHTVDASGRRVTALPGPLAAACAPAPPPQGSRVAPLGPPPSCFTAISRLGYRQQVTYQPAGRFWALQWTETGLFLVLTAGLSGLCLFWTRRRLS